ncbi:hypothetical protein CSKR_106777 [Clonorchis sinensis]|uniref:Uncharacterized protein n=1 Tax=Clonorchis sinensis TaxID=79923 RepID=A0A3R7CE82_CLOSI|nr:hypothetical protein CSKR_106777 [Clonorchis sinensis]
MLSVSETRISTYGWSFVCQNGILNARKHPNNSAHDDADKNGNANSDYDHFLEAVKEKRRPSQRLTRLVVAYCMISPKKSNPPEKIRHSYPLTVYPGKPQVWCNLRFITKIIIILLIALLAFRENGKTFR